MQKWYTIFIRHGLDGNKPFKSKLATSGRKRPGYYVFCDKDHGNISIVMINFLEANINEILKQPRIRIYCGCFDFLLFLRNFNFKMKTYRKKKIKMI